jgi:hypothetical protein
MNKSWYVEGLVVNRSLILMLTLLLIVIISVAPQVNGQTFRVYTFVTTDAPIYKPGSTLIAEAYIFPQLKTSVQATIKFRFTDLPGAPQIPSVKVTIPSIDEKPVVIVKAKPVIVPDVNDGTYHLEMQVIVGGQVVYRDTVEFWIRHGPPSGKPPMILFVWHNHQAPNYWPSGEFFANWHVDHFFHDGLAPYYTMNNTYPDMGTYYLHYYLVKKYPNVKVNLHYSPSLLYQLYIAATRGFKIYVPSKGRTVNIPPNSTMAETIREFFKGLKQLYEEDKVYIMTTEFAHTIAGYIINKLDIPYLLKYDIWLGKEWTKKVLGVDTDAIWTAEMAWSDKLVPIYLDLGFKYTVLDGTYHFPGAQGDKGTIYEPYIIKDSSGRELIIFFRDQEVSDGYIGFANQKWSTPKAADEWARQLYYHIYDKHSFKNYKYPPLEVIAADGENWILFAPSHANAALFLDRVYAYINKLSEEGIMTSGTFKDAVKVHPPERVLTSIPWTSWLGSWDKWTVQKGRDQINMWNEVYYRIGKYKAILYYKGIDSYNKFINLINTNQAFNKSVIDLIHALDSDFWWAEFFNPPVINAWLKEFDKDSSTLLKYRVEINTIPKIPVAKASVKIIAMITNLNKYTMRNTYITLSMPGVNATSAKISIRPGSTVNITLIVKSDKPKTKSIVLTMYTPNARVGNTVFYMEHRVEEIKFVKPIDLTLQVTITGPNGQIGGANPTPPGTHKILVTYMISNGGVAGFDIPVEITLVIDGKAYTKKSFIYRGDSSETIVFNIPLDTGIHDYKVELSSPYDPYIDNNVIRGEIVVTQQTSSGGGAGGNEYTLLIVAIILWIIVGVLLTLYFVKYRKK